LVNLTSSKISKTSHIKLMNKSKITRITTKVSKHNTRFHLENKCNKIIKILNIYHFILLIIRVINLTIFNKTNIRGNKNIIRYNHNIVYHTWLTIIKRVKISRLAQVLDRIFKDLKVLDKVFKGLMLTKIQLNKAIWYKI